MLLQKPIDLLLPIQNVYEDLRYRDSLIISDLRSKINEKRLFIDFTKSVDALFLHALQQYSNLNTILLFGVRQEDAYEKFVENYKTNYIIYGIKEIELKKSNWIKAFYQLFYYRHKKMTYQEYINYILTFFSNNEVFDNASDEDEIYISVLIVSKRIHTTNFYELEDSENIIIPKNKEEQWIFTTLLFNRNSLDFLEKQDLKFYLKNDNRKYWIKMNSFIESVNEIVSIEKRHRILLYSSTILYFIGHRPNNDFDFMISCKDEENDIHQVLREYEIRENQNYFDQNSNKDDLKGIYDFSYIHTSNNSIRRKYYEDFYDVWAQKYGVSKFETIFANNNHHMYFLGMKSTTIQIDILRRILRNRPRAIADLIALRKRYNIKVDLPEIPEFREKFHKVAELNNEEKEKLLNNGGTLVSDNDGEKIREMVRQSRNDFVSTVKWALEQRYGMDFTISEVMIELGIEKDTSKNTFHIRKEESRNQENTIQNLSDKYLNENENQKEEKKKMVIKIKDAVSNKTVTKTISSTESSVKPKRKVVFK